MTSLSLVLLRTAYAIDSPLVDLLPLYLELTVVTLYRELPSLFLNLGKSESTVDLIMKESKGFDPEKDLSLLFNSSAKLCPGIIKGFTLAVRMM